MIIRHNDAANRVGYALHGDVGAAQAALEKLSSGLKLNKAADDAAGLAISEKMKAQINGLTQADDNVKTAASMIQTAEGSLAQAQDILQRLNVLAVQAQNGTLADSDRAALRQEAEALQEGLDQLVSTSDFNTIPLFDKKADASLFSQDGIEIQMGADSGQQLSVNLNNAVKADWVGVENGPDGSAGVLMETEGGPTSVTFGYSFSTSHTAGGNWADPTLSIDSSGAGGTVNIGGTDFTIEDVTVRQTVTVGGVTQVQSVPVTSSAFASGVTQIDGVSFSLVDSGGHVFENAASGASIYDYPPGRLSLGSGDNNVDLYRDYTAAQPVDIGGSPYTATYGESIPYPGSPAVSDHPVAFSLTDENGNDVKAALFSAGGDYAGASIGAGGFAGTVSRSGDGAVNGLASPPPVYLTLNKMATVTSGSSNGLYLSASEAMGLGVSFFDGTATHRLDIASGQAITLIQNAIDDASTFRARLGAYQNRFTAVDGTLTVENENLASSLSNITDVDMAKEMTAYTKNSLLVQASQAMLAQANQLPQGTLSLLR